MEHQRRRRHIRGLKDRMPPIRDGGVRIHIIEDGHKTAEVHSDIEIEKSEDEKKDNA